MNRIFSLVPFLGFALLLPAHSDVAPGEFVLAEMNCVACHDAPGAIKNRLASRQAPRLGKDGLQLTPQWLRAFLVKPGPTMPDLLHSLPGAEKAEAAEALTQYLVSFQSPDTGVQHGASTAAIAAGKKLYHTLGCVACHTPHESPPVAPNDNATKSEMNRLQRDSIPLGDLARKFTVNELAAFLRDPVKTRSSGRMPSLKLDEGESRAIAMYLLREQVVGGEPTKLEGLAYEYYEASFPELPEFDRLKPKATGTTEKFTLAVAQRKNDYALRFRGILTIAKAGDYTFYTMSDDGSRLYVDEKLVVDNGGIHPEQERDGKVKLPVGEHTITATFFQGGGGDAFKVSWKGPGINKNEIPARVLSHEGQPMRPLDDAPFTVDEAKAAKGKELFTSLNCAACHPIDVPGKKTMPLLQLAGSKGCLSSTPPAAAPKYAFTDRQRTDLSSQLTNLAALSQPLTDAEQVARTMTVLNCYACHSRGKRGGPAGLRSEFFTTAVDADLGDEGRMPPHLDGVGVKLKPGWMERALWQGASVRPYMATRMPQFGQANVKHLVAAFAKADTASTPATELAVDDTLAKAGHKLTGTGGLSCVQCHVFAGRPSLGVPALDLTTVYERLEGAWFRRYLLDPISLRPGTRMPSFWPNGKAVREDILNGNTEKQIAALWSYLSKGKSADIPVGLIAAKQELVADKETQIYRHWIQGAGARAIAVGYPEKLNLAFDAHEIRVALLWQGPFMDASKHRSGRGDGFQPPLGYAQVKWTPGAPFASLTTTDAPWPADTGRKAGYQFRGYNLDDKLRPTFRYTFGDVQVEDYFVAVPMGDDAVFKRTVTVRSEKSPANLFFRAAAAAKIEEKGDSYLVDGKVRIKITGVKATLRASGNQTELLVPVVFNKKEAKFAEELSW